MLRRLLLWGCVFGSCLAPVDDPNGRLGASDAGADAGTQRDAGAPTDAGAPFDAGAPLDAGAPSDAGAPVDAGPPCDCPGGCCTATGACLAVALQSQTACGFRQSCRACDTSEVCSLGACTVPSTQQCSAFTTGAADSGVGAHQQSPTLAQTVGLWWVPDGGQFDAVRITVTQPIGAPTSRVLDGGTDPFAVVFSVGCTGPVPTNIFWSDPTCRRFLAVDGEVTLYWLIAQTNGLMGVSWSRPLRAVQLDQNSLPIPNSCATWTPAVRFVQW